MRMDYSAKHRKAALRVVFGMGWSLTCQIWLVMAVSSATATGLDPDAVVLGPARQSAPCLSQDSSREIRARLRMTVENLTQRGILAAEPLASSTTRTGAMAWPVAPPEGLSLPGIHGIGAFVDHNPSYPSQLLDYECGGRTYDTASGANHRGTDIFPWPFGWYRMEHTPVVIRAALPGTIIGKDDGNFDRSCGFTSTPWNAVYVRHADGSTLWYGHMKSGSLTTKSVGETVTEGDYLGAVGSSGSSTGPHLHLELHDAHDNVIDPYAGACNNTTAESWWQGQRPYVDSTINLVATHDERPEFPSCPQAEVPHIQDVFQPGQQVTFAVYYRDPRSWLTSTYSVVKPDGGVQWTWQYAPTVDTYSVAGFVWQATLSAGAPLGSWRFKVSFLGQDYEHMFNVGTEPTATPTPTSGPTVTPTPTMTAVPAAGGGAVSTLVLLIGVLFMNMRRRPRLG
ncbi:MAG: peptidoglycan DD-metalloendopeptidase family protein [Candidatus Schekmanbacteria bacterium]|nr:peptidoglycan DD-metalloendopeptidase family protein [Candidatus Schekmanbacteria bacterium]